MLSVMVYHTTLYAFFPASADVSPEVLTHYRFLSLRNLPNGDGDRD